MLTAWYVATTGAAANSGAFDQPFATIQEAANVAQAGDTVYIMGGVYHETVAPPGSGAPGAPITFEPYDGQSVTIDGADPLTGWSLYKGSIYSAPQSWDLGEGNNQVFVDGTMVNEARWPNTPAHVADIGSIATAPANISTPNWATATSVSASISTVTNDGTPPANGIYPPPSTVTIYNASLNQPAGTWVGSIAHIAAGQEWVDQVGTVTASSPGSITVAYQNETSSQIPRAGNRFYIVGNFKALDSAGEWYRDPASGKLYLWDPAGDSPANRAIEAKARDFGFDLSGVSNIDVTGIDLFACTINTDARSSNNVLNGISAQYVSQAVGITPDNLLPWEEKLHPHTTGIILNGTGNVLENSTIAFSSGDGVFLGGSSNTVENTVIHDVDYEAGDDAGISSLGTSETILGNTIYNAGRSGVVCRYTYGSLISHNVVHTVGLQMTDLGGIYTWGTNGQGTEISYNVVYDIHTAGDGAAGIYLDNYSQDFVVDHNLVFDCDAALKLNPPSLANLVVNNTFVGTQYGLATYGSEDMTGSTLLNNIFVGQAMLGPGLIQSHNIFGSTNPAFVNAGADNFQLSSTSRAIGAGAVLWPYSSQYLGSAPDIGAYEYGMMPFDAGAAADPFIPPAPSSSSPAPAKPITPTIDWPTPANIPVGTPLGASELDATSVIPGTFAYTPSAGTMLGIGDGQALTVTFTPFDTIDYTTATASVTIRVFQPATPAITWANPADTIYGTALGAAQLDATSAIPGTFSYAPSAGAVLGAGDDQTLLVTFTPADTYDYSTATASVAINVAPATPPISWPDSPAVIYGTPLGAAQLDAASSVPGTFVYTPGAGTLLEPGDNQALSAIFTPEDSVDYTPAPASAMINIVLAPATPMISWPNPAAITYGAPLGAAQLDATSSIPGTFVYSPGAGTILTPGDAQTLWVAFTPTDSIDYTSATASAEINVSKAVLTVNANNLSRAYGTANPSLTYAFSGFMNGDTAGVVSGAASLSMPAVSSSPAGVYPITLAANTLAASNYTFNLVNGNLTVTRAATRISVVSSGPTVFGQSATFTATVTPASGGGLSGAVQFQANGINVGSPVNISSGKASLTTAALSAGTQSITAIYTGSANFSASTSKAVSQSVGLDATATALATSSAATVWGQPVTFTIKVAAIAPGSGTPTGDITFKNGSTVLKTVNLSGGVATLSVANLSVAIHSITAIYSGSSNFTASASNSVVQTIKKSATITMLSTSAASIKAAQPLTLTAAIAPVAPGAGLPSGSVTFRNGTTVIGTIAISAGKAILVIKTLGRGTHKISASYTGDANFLGGVSASITQVIS